MMWAIHFVEVLGFFFQFYPCALLCFLPFGAEKLAAPKGRVLLCLTLGAVAAAALFPVAIHLTGADTYMWFKLGANGYMLLVIVLMVAAYILWVRENVMKKLLVVYVVILYAALIYWLSNGFAVLMQPYFGNWSAGYLSVYGPSYLILYAITLVTLFPLVCLFMRRSVAAFLREIEPARMRREFHYATLSTAAFLALMMAADLIIGTRLGLGLGKFVILFLVLNQALLYWMIFTSAVNRSREENALRAVQAQKLQYDKISADMELAARMRHDMRHHWNYLYSLAEAGDLDGIRDYLSSLTARAGRRESETFCADPTVNALLQYYIGLARDGGVACTVAAVCGVLNVPAEDLVVIIGNVLENAVGACLRAGGSTVIDVKAGVLHGEFVFEVVNSYSGIRLAGDCEDAGGFLPASAFLSIRGGAGRGIASVADLARKHLGSAVFRYDGEKRLFTTRVILNQA